MIAATIAENCIERRKTRLSMYWNATISPPIASGMTHKPCHRVGVPRRVRKAQIGGRDAHQEPAEDDERDVVGQSCSSKTSTRRLGAALRITRRIFAMAGSYGCSSVVSWI